MKTFTGSFRNVLLKTGACICIGLGVIGAFLPVLPTTPFLILATILSYNSSPKLRNWLLGHPVFGETIRKFLESRSITAATMWRALGMLWLCLLFSIWLVENYWVDLFLVVTGLLVSLYLIRLRIAGDNDSGQQKE